ncbi:HipA domain-containing protein [Variovorax robiniae]|uniref:HipA domain-containing protein n=1 Tax=Variovorax robiniae TaxID=1836199 RepID=A0ABU8X9B2_9BURK
MKATTDIRETVDICVGQAGIPVGSLIYSRQGRRENSAFAYGQGWLASSDRFTVSPDLELIAAHQFRKAPTKDDSPFFLALADTAPDAWGRRVILRDHAKRRQSGERLRDLNELDFLRAVDDFSRVGALRLRDGEGTYHRSVDAGKRATPPFVDLGKLYSASRAVETGSETAQDLRYLRGNGTSLGGMRPKATVIDHSGLLAIGKFPSINDDRSITCGEVLALRLAALAGIDAARARIELIEDAPVALIQRFDRTADSGRIPYMSAGSLLQASRQDEHSYTEIVDAMRANSADPVADARQLWRRMAFNHLITNVDDHLQNHGFLHVGSGFWRMAPAFDINPFPDKARESKTWLSEADGPIVSIEQLMGRSDYFHLSAKQAHAALADIYGTVIHWRELAMSAEVGLTAAELEAFAPAFEHEALEEARLLLR